MIWPKIRFHFHFHCKSLPKSLWTPMAWQFTVIVTLREFFFLPLASSTLRFTMRHTEEWMNSRTWKFEFWIHSQTMKNRQCFHLLFLFTFLSLFLIVSSTTPNPNTTAAEDTKEEEANDDEPEAEATTVTVDPAAFPMKSRMRRLKMERHTSNKFNLLSIRTSLESHLPYSSLPRIGSKQGSMNEAELLREMTGTTDCDVMLSIYLLRGKRRGLRNMCVYRIKTEEEIFQKVGWMGNNNNYCSLAVFMLILKL